MTYVWSITPDTGMIDFPEGVVVRTLYGYSSSPEAEEIIQKVSNEIEYFILYIKPTLYTMAMIIDDGDIICYSKQKRRPMNVNDALDKIAIGDTSDIMFYEHDLLPSCEANNLLGDVISNAELLMRIHPLIRDACRLGTPNTTGTQGAGVIRIDSVEISDNTKPNGRDSCAEITISKNTAYPDIQTRAALSDGYSQQMSLDRETRTAVPTDTASHYLNRKPQTLRAWACHENGPIRPVRINGRLGWKVAEIRALLNGGQL
jgi:hypothetical protein